MVATRSHAPIGVYAVALILLVIAALGITALPVAAATRTCGGKPVTIHGTSGPDEIHGTAGDDVIAGRQGSDVIDGRGGHDTICGGRGRDFLHGGAGNDAAFGSYGHDRLYGGDGNDYLNGGRGSDRAIDGGDGDDVLRGGDADIRGDTNTANGQAGDDMIVGGTGADNLSGGPGDDVIRDPRVGSDDSEISLGDGNDGIHGTTACSFRCPELRFVWPCSETDTGTLDLAAGTYSSPTGHGTVTGRFVVVAGSRCDERIIGTDRREVLYTGGGDDSIDGRGGNDRIHATLDADISSSHLTLDGGAGTDEVSVDRLDTESPVMLEVFGEPGELFLMTTDSDVEVDLTLDTISGSSLTGTIVGFQHVTLDDPGYYGDPSFTLIGDAQANKLTTGYGADKIYGRGGDDILSSRWPADEFWGEGGIDTVDAGGSNAIGHVDICAGETLSGCEDIRPDTNVGAE